MTASSQQPDEERAPLTSPAAAGSGPTGHDKAVEIVREIGRFHRPTSVSVVRQSVTCQCGVESTDTDGLERHRAELSLAALRAALAAGDADVAEALGLSDDRPEWGVRFADGSVRHVWNGRTAREHAEKSAAFLRERYAPDRIVLVRRSTLHTDWTGAP